MLLQSSSTTKSIRRLTVAHLAFPSPSHSLPELESMVTCQLLRLRYMGGFVDGFRGEWRGMAGRGREREE
ncbi:hypothetical protein ACFX2G_036025 [Malus domestica]